jgi:hypothetical protein
LRSAILLERVFEPIKSHSGIFMAYWNRWCLPGSTLKKKKGRASDQCGYEQRIDWRIGPCANPRIGASRAPTLTVLIIG